MAAGQLAEGSSSVDGLSSQVTLGLCQVNSWSCDMHYHLWPFSLEKRSLAESPAMLAVKQSHPPVSGPKASGL